MDNVERQPQSLVELIVSIYKGNNALRRLVMNVEPNTSLIASVFHYYDTRNDLLLMLTAGPSVNLSDYLITMDRLEDVIKYFKYLEVVDEQKHVIELYDIGRQKFIEESDQLIMQHSNPISTTELLELCTSSSSISVDIHSAQVSDLGAFRVIFDWFKEHGFQQGLINSYVEKRSTMICNSFKLLAEHLRRKTVRRASFNIPSNSPRSSSRRSSYGSDSIREQIRTKFSEIGHRLTRSPIIGGKDPSIKNTFLLPPETETHHDLLDVDNFSLPLSFIDNRETNNYKFLLDAFVILLSHELELLFYAFSNEFKSLVFTKLIEFPLIYLHEEAQQLCTAIEQLPCKIDTGKFAFYGLFSIAQWFHRSKSILTKLSCETNLAPEHQFNNALFAIFEHSISKCLHLVSHEVRNDSSPLSPGGNVHPLTRNVVHFMEDLLDYEDTISSIQINYIEEKQITTNDLSLSADKNFFNLSNYFADLIRALHASISQKIELFVPNHDKTIRAIFLLNNTNYLLRRLENSSLLTIIEKAEPNLKLKLENNMQKCIQVYIECYTPITDAIQQMFNYDKLNHLPNSSLRDCDRDQLKTNFLLLNTTIDNLRHQHEEYIIDDIQLRDHLRNESKKVVLNMFKIYYNQFAHKHFTHHPEKYIQYNPSMLESIIEQFFEH